MIKFDSFLRYSRQIYMDEVSTSGQRKIMNSKILIVGAGGLGSPIIQYLAAAGIGKIAVVDFDILELHNLHRQVLHNESFIGQPKVNSAKNFVSALNSNIQFIPINIKIDVTNAEKLLKQYDIIVDGSDNFETRFLINDMCVSLQKPLVYGSINSFEGQMGVFNYQNSKNLRDLYPEPPDSRDIKSCEMNGVLGPLAGIIGSMMAMQTLKIILGLLVDTNQLTLIDTMHWNFTKINF